MEKLKALEDKKVSEFQTKLKLQENIYDQTKGLNNRGFNSVLAQRRNYNYN